MNSKEITDTMALKELIDSVSLLGDQRAVHEQVQLFTENAISETFANDTLILSLQGRQAMEAAFVNFIKDFDTVYHFNGQHQVIVNGDNATGTAYCLITLIGTENGKKMITNIGAVYRDEYVREYSRWLIAKRTGNFVWQEKRAASY